MTRLPAKPVLDLLAETLLDLCAGSTAFDDKGETFEGVSFSHAQECLKYRGFKNVSNYDHLCDCIEAAGFKVIRARSSRNTRKGLGPTAVCKIITL